jgi:hypothetical protein
MMDHYPVFYERTSMNHNVRQNILLFRVVSIYADVKNIFELTFIRQLLLGTDGVFKEHEEINNVWNSSPLAMYLRDTEIKRYNSDRNIYSYGAQIKLSVPRLYSVK